MRNQDLHKSLLRAASLWLFLFVYTPLLFSQTSNIGGTVNVYQKVVEVIPAKACVRVSSTAGLNPKAKVLLVQMKGASINTANSSAFGDTTALNEAGNYEVATICAIRVDSVFLVHNLLNTYSPAAGKMQLVQFGEYVAANVTGPLIASPWNNATGTGGVIAIYVEEDLTLNQSISTDANGFKGGAFVQSNTVCTNSMSAYVYNATFSTPQNGAYKGEGIADVTAAQSGGRGAPANGGGGGNNHNNSGGGGANLTRGGMGGGNSSTSGCTAAFKGEAGKALSNWNGKKIFLGGGGGAGHNNNGVFTQGGASGGGIIFIHADNIVGNGFSITANGGMGGNTQADGAGGGGGGGTIIIDAANYTGSLTVQAKGGDGGGSDDGGNIGKCYGGGGGGSGGAIYFNGALPAITSTVAAGAAGLEWGRDASCVAAQPAAPGNAGQIITGYNYRISNSIAGYCSLILPTELIFFKATPSQKKVILQWEVADPEQLAIYLVQRMNTNNEWETLTAVTGNDNQQDYSVTDNNPSTGYNLYRLKIINKSNSFFYSTIRRAFIEGDEKRFAIYPNPTTNKLFINAAQAEMTNIRLLDISGKVVLQKTMLISNGTQISLPSLPAGMYVLHLNETVRKLMIR